jgi:hypothetical protein
MIALERARQTLDLALGEVCILALPSIRERAIHARPQLLGQMLSDVQALVLLAACFGPS